MRLYLVQHGKAKTKEEDPDRHLTDEGLMEIEKVAEFIKPLGLNVGSIWHSGKVRAVQTAEVLATAVKVDNGLTKHDGLAPNDPVDRVVREVEQSKEDVMIVGHLPFLSKLVSRLVAGDESIEVVAFRNGGMVCLERDSEGKWKLRWMITPDVIV